MLIKNKNSENNNSLLIVILDGWKQSVFEDLLAKKQLRGMERIIDDGMKLDTVISNLPSVSIASHLSILSGSYIDQHAIPGHRWLDRNQNRIRTYFSADVSKKINKDASKNVNLIFENRAFNSTISVQGIVRRGAKKFSYSPVMAGQSLLKKTAKILRRNPNSAVVTWLPKVDSLAHSYGPESPQVRKEMIDTSKAFEKFVVNLSEHGLYDKLKILLVPDHGQREVIGSVKLEKLFEKVGLSSVVNPKKFEKTKQIILTSGDSSAQVYLSDDQISKRSDIADKLCLFDEIEIICWKDGQDWHIVNKKGHSVARWINQEIKQVSYRVIQGDDPLGINRNRHESIINLSIPSVTMYDYPDFLHQIMRSYVENRSGDMMIFPSKKFHFGRAPRIGFRFGFHKGTHGGLFPDEMVVSAICKGFDIENKPVRLAELMDTLGVNSFRDIEK